MYVHILFLISNSNSIVYMFLLEMEDEEVGQRVEVKEELHGNQVQDVTKSLLDQLLLLM